MDIHLDHDGQKGADIYKQIPYQILLKIHRSSLSRDMSGNRVVYEAQPSHTTFSRIIFFWKLSFLDYYHYEYQ